MTAQPLPGDRTPTQQRAEEALEAHPYRLELRGAPSALAWPTLCANCGQATSERIRVSKPFYRQRHWGRSQTQKTPFDFRIVSADVPFCPPCIARHRQALPRRSAIGRLRTFLLNPAHVGTIGCAALLTMVVPAALDMTGSSAMATWGFAGVLLLGILWILGLTWWTTRPDRLEPRTEVTRACDFSDNVALAFERERHIYTMRNQAFADAMAEANRDRVWTESDQSRMRRTSGFVFLAILIVLIIVRVWMWYHGSR